MSFHKRSLHFCCEQNRSLYQKSTTISKRFTSQRNPRVHRGNRNVARVRKQKNSLNQLKLSNTCCTTSRLIVNNKIRKRGFPPTDMLLKLLYCTWQETKTSSSLILFRFSYLIFMYQSYFYEFLSILFCLFDTHNLNTHVPIQHIFCIRDLPFSIIFLL